MLNHHNYGRKKYTALVIIPIIAFWTILFFLRYPIPSIDDPFFIGAAINLAKGGEFTNPYIESWNSVLTSGKFYFQPPFHSYILAGWLKIAGISTNSLLLFQFLCYSTFSLFCTLLLRFYRFPIFTVFLITLLFATWHCNPNPLYTTGFRQDALGMAFLALGLWLITKDSWWRYFLGFIFLESAVFTSPITLAYGFSFGVAILTINYIHSGKFSQNKTKYFFNKTLLLLGATALVFTIFLICINFDLKTFITDFSLHTSLRRTSTFKAIPTFIMLVSQGYGFILNVPTYVLFLCFVIGVFNRRYFINIERKILFTGLSLGVLSNILLYASAVWVTFFFCWLGIVLIISQINWRSKNMIYLPIITAFIFLSSQSLNIISLVGREYTSESSYQEIRQFFLANPNRKYAFDEVAARFIFDYKFPQNSTCWSALKPAPASYPSAKDKLADVTWIVATYNLGKYAPEIQPDYPKIEFIGHKFNTLPKKPFDVTIVP